MSLIGQRVGNYEIKSKLGEGGMGVVYLGEHPLIGKKVAIKVLLEDYATNESVVSRFFNEAKAVNDIGHANIVDIIDFGKMQSEAGGQVVYFVMELLQGDSLATRLQKKPPSLQETLHIIKQCCSALAASHKKGIIHRDLKPDNLYLCPRGTDKNFVKILDFGIAKLTKATGEDSNSKTRTGTVIGTPYYMSPEQCAGRGNIDHRADIYSLGVVMYELVTGRVPFTGEGFGDILVKQLTEAPEPPSKLRADLPPAIEAIILRAMEKDKEKRFQSMDEFSLALDEPQQFLAGKTTGSDFVFKPLFPDEPSRVGPLPGPDSGSHPVDATTKPPSGVTPIIDPNAAKPRTTLSGAASELGRSGSKRASSLLAAAAVVATLGGGTGLYLWRSHNIALQLAQQPVAPPPVEQLLVRFTTNPPGADVVRADGTFAGKTPVELHVAKGAPGFDVQLRLAGYKTSTRSVATDISQAISIDLDKLAPVVTVPTPAPVPVPVVVKPTTTTKKKKHVSDDEDNLKDALPPDFGP